MVAVTRPSPRANPTARADRALVVVSDAGIAALLDVCLSTAGIEVVLTGAESADEVAMAVSHHQPDAVVAELPIPGAPFGTRFSELQDHPGLRRVALVGLTTYPPHHADRWLRAGDAIVGMPFAIGELEQAIERSVATVRSADDALLSSAPWPDRRNAARGA